MSIDFPNVSFDSPAEYKEFILSHKDAEKTGRNEWINAAKMGKTVIPYCNSASSEKPIRETIVYFEFVDSDFNIYVEFFNRDTKAWIESFRFTDEEMSWTIAVDNWYYGNPLKLENVPEVPQRETCHTNPQDK